MLIHQFDHVYGYVKNNDLNRALARMHLAGFTVSPKMVKHDAGHLNRFVQMGSTYLEFQSVVDEGAFSLNATENDRLYRAFLRPYGIGAITSSTQRIYDSLKGHFSHLSSPFSKSEGNPPTTPPRWKLIDLPNGAFPGAHTFALEYLMKREEATIGPNQITMLGGFYFCSDHPNERMNTWTRTMNLLGLPIHCDATSITLGHQIFYFITPNEYQGKFGELWKTTPNENGEIAAVILNCANVEFSAEAMKNAGFGMTNQDSTVNFKMDKITGFTFALRKQDS